MRFELNASTPTVSAVLLIECDTLREPGQVKVRPNYNRTAKGSRSIAINRGQSHLSAYSLSWSHVLDINGNQQPEVLRRFEHFVFDSRYFLETFLRINPYEAQICHPIRHYFATQWAHQKCSIQFRLMLKCIEHRQSTMITDFSAFACDWKSISPAARHSIDIRNSANGAVDSAELLNGISTINMIWYRIAARHCLCFGVSRVLIGNYLFIPVCRSAAQHWITGVWIAWMHIGSAIHSKRASQCLPIICASGKREILPLDARDAVAHMRPRTEPMFFVSRMHNWFDWVLEVFDNFSIYSIFRSQPLDEVFTRSKRAHTLPFEC